MAFTWRYLQAGATAVPNILRDRRNAPSIMPGNTPSIMARGSPALRSINPEP
jgi:hypothetical protein